MSYQYTPLNIEKKEIRILDILPFAIADGSSTSSSTGLISCNLRTVSLDDFTPEFSLHLFASFFSSSSPSVGNPIPGLRTKKFSSAGEAFNLLNGHIQNSSMNADRWNWGDYTALTYAWESFKGSAEILLEGYRFRVTRNLECFLRELARRAGQEEMRGVSVWVDALCINQGDLGERDEQVPMMGAIYQMARCAVAWMGPGDESTDEGMALVESIASNIQQGEEGLQRARDIRSGEITISPQAWNGLYLLAQRTYWSRLWVVQEIALSSTALTFICGSSSSPRFNFQNVINFLFQNYQATIAAYMFECDLLPNVELEVAEFYAALRKTRYMLDDGKGTGKCEAAVVVKLMSGLWQYGCLDPRDRIYGVLSLFPEKLAAEIKPSYAASVADVYMDFAMQVIHATMSLDIICRGGLNSTILDENTRDREGWPSWVPDWRGRQVVDEHLHLLEPGNYTASGEHKPHISLSSPKILSCSGFAFDTISSTGYGGWDNSTEDNSTKDNSTKDNSLPSHPSSRPLIYGTKGSPEAMKALLLTLLGDLTGKRRGVSDAYLENFGKCCQLIIPLKEEEQKFRNYAPSIMHTFAFLDSLERHRDAMIGEMELVSYFVSPAGLDQKQLEVEGDDLINKIENIRIAEDENNKENGDENRSEKSQDWEKIIEDEDEDDEEEGESDEEQDYDGTLAEEACQGAFTLSSGRRLLVTAKGYLAWATEGIKQGDQICILYGCSVPVVLRPEGGGRWKLVGECYVQGVMDGEALDWVERGKVEVVGFEIY